MAKALLSLVTALETTPQKPVCELPIPPSAERERMLYDWNDTGGVYPHGECLHTLFEQQVQHTPDAMAVMAEGETLSYAALNGRANRLAHYLRAQGVGPDERLAVCAERSAAIMVALLEILKAEGAYVPLDPGYPRKRLNYILEDAAQALMLANATSGLQMLDTPSGPVITLDDLATLTSGLPEDNLAPASLSLSECHLAYVIYTSGSTGHPKGVMNEHSGSVNRLRWMQERYGLTASDAVLQKTPFSFDVWMWEFFWPLMTGRHW